MERDFTQLTQQENEILTQAQSSLRERGIQMENDENGIYNGNLIMKSFRDSSVPITLDGIVSVANQLADKLRYTSKIAKQLSLSHLTAAELDELQDFMNRKPLVKLDGSNDGFHNAALLVEWLRRYNYPINLQTLQKAMEGFTYSQSTDPKQLLRWLETPRSAPRGRWSQDDDPNRKPGQLFSEPTTTQTDGPRFVNGRLNHATDTRYQQKPAAPVLDASEAAWKKLADSKLGAGGSHSGNAAIQEAYDNALATGASYRQVNDAVSKVVKRLQMVRS